MIIKKINLDKFRFIFFCGDIHGYYRKLMKQLKLAGFNRKLDALVCTGDLIDRGSENLECLSLLDEDWFFSVQGNHEKLMINALTGENQRVCSEL